MGFWSHAALEAIEGGLAEIPVVGKLLETLVSIFWYSSPENVWQEIKQQVEELVEQKISEDDYNRVKAVLGNAGEQTGLIGVMLNYLGSISKNNNNGQDPEQTWIAANEAFVAGSGAFEQTGIEILLLPLFAPMANLHLTLLRDGVEQKFCDVSELQERIKLYVDWANEYVGRGFVQRSAAAQGQFNYVNVWSRFMQLNVVNFSVLWPYFDPTKYPPPVKDVTIPQLIYYTVTEMMGSGYQSLNYDVDDWPDGPDGDITGIGVYWYQENDVSYNVVLGSQLSYTTGQTAPYSGVLFDGQPPPRNGTNPDNTYHIFHYQPVPVSAANPIVSIDGVYDTSAGTYCVDFGFQDGSSTGQIPAQAGNSGYTVPFTIKAPAGYYLTSIWSPPEGYFYDMVADMVFGFRLKSESPGLAPV